MDAYEATKVVFSRIQAMDPDQAAKIMGLLLIQDHGEKEMIRLAFGPEALLASVITKARKDLGLVPGSNPGTPTSNPVQSPFVSRQNSSPTLRLQQPPPPPLSPSPLSVSSPLSWAPPPIFSRSNEDDEAAGVGSPYFASLNQAGDPSMLEELQMQEQLAFLNDVGPNGHPLSPGGGAVDGNGFFPYGAHRRSQSVSDLCLNGVNDGGLGWKPCLYYARGYCKNGSSCRFVHGLPDDMVKMDAAVEQQCQELLLRSKSQRLAAAFPYSPNGSLPVSPSAATKCLSILLQQQQNDNQRAAAAAATAALMLGGGGDDMHKFMGRPRFDRTDFANMLNPGSRQIYLTFPADSTFREEDVSNYFSIYGPVQDVRIPYQQKRMFGFVTFVYPETVKLILAKGNPHFICDARVLVKPYKEKGKVPEKYRNKLPGERGDFSPFSGCSTPTGLDTRDPFDLHQLGARMLHSNSTNEMLLRRKLEEQQQAAELQQAIEMQSSRLMGLQLLDLKARSASLPTPITSGYNSSSNVATPVVESPPDSEEQQLMVNSFLPQQKLVNGVDKEESTGEGSPNADSDFQESSEHNLPDSPFASPTKSGFALDPFATNEAEISVSSAAVNTTSYVGMIGGTGNGNGNGSTNHLLASTLFQPTTTFDIPSPKPYYFPMSRLSSDHGAIGM